MRLKPAPAAKVSIVVEYADGGSQTLEIPVAQNVEIEEKYEEPQVIFDPISGGLRLETAPTLERLTVSMRPLRGTNGSLYTHTLTLPDGGCPK